MSVYSIKVGLDFDGVLVWYDINLFFDYCQTRLGWPVDHAHFARTHNINEAMGGKTVPEVTRAFTKFLLGHEDVQHPVPGAYQALRQLVMSCSLHLFTARAAALRAVTLRALSKHYPGIDFTTIAWGRALAKASMVSQQRIRVYVEDSTPEIMLMLEAGVNATIIQFPAFTGCPQHNFHDEKVIRLTACNFVQDACTLMDRRHLWQTAWQQAGEQIQQYLEQVLFPAS